MNRFWRFSHEAFRFLVILFIYFSPTEPPRPSFSSSESANFPQPSFTLRSNCCRSDGWHAGGAAFGLCWNFSGRFYKLSTAGRVVGSLLGHGPLVASLKTSFCPPTLVIRHHGWNFWDFEPSLGLKPTDASSFLIFIFNFQEKLCKNCFSQSKKKKKPV